MDQKAHLLYLEWQDLYHTEKPYQVFSSAAVASNPAFSPSQQDRNPAAKNSTNLVFTPGPCETIHDARGREAEFSLDEHGFQFARHGLAAAGVDVDFGDRRAIESVYLPEVEALVKRVVDGAEEVFFYDWRIRKNKDITGKSVIDANDKMQHLLPAKQAHIDLTPAAVVGRVYLHMKERAEYLLQGRVRVINIWRPIVPVVEDWPLALCDGRSIPPAHLVEADHIRKHYSGTNYYALPSDQYRWYYLNRQTKDEVTFLKNFDSDPNVPANREDFQLFIGSMPSN